MHYSTVTTMLLALTPAFTLGLPTLAARQTSDEGVGNAQVYWYQDTFLVSQFLSEATSLSGQDLANAAASALGSENDEPIHKGVIDSLLPNDPNIQAANNILITQGTF